MSSTDSLPALATTPSERVAELEAENKALRRHLDQRASGTDPLTELLRSRVAALEERIGWLETRHERLAIILRVWRAGKTLKARLRASSVPPEAGTPTEGGTT